MGPDIDICQFFQEHSNAGRSSTTLFFVAAKFNRTLLTRTCWDRNRGVVLGVRTTVWYGVELLPSPWLSNQTCCSGTTQLNAYRTTIAVRSVQGFRFVRSAASLRSAASHAQTHRHRHSRTHNQISRPHSYRTDGRSESNCLSSPLEVT